MIIKFTVNDIDYQKAYERALRESVNICAGPARNGRSDETILENCLQGHIAEQYCIEKFGMDNCELKYHDLEKDGKIYEIKSSTSMTYLRQQFRRIATCDWNKSHVFMGFLVKDGTYELVIYEEL